MKINLDELNICVINLPERIDRLNQFSHQIKKILSNSSYNIIEGIRDKNPMVGIAKAHTNCIKLAKDNNWPYVLICEDDLIFKANNNNTLNKYIRNALDNAPDDFNILLGGLYNSGKLTSYNQFWYKTNEFCGLQFYIVHNNCYDRILAFTNNMHIDRWYAHTKGANLNCFVTKQFFALQSNGLSDNVNKEVNYDRLLLGFKLLK